MLDFARKSINLVDHHFNDHTNCGEWCPYSAIKGEVQKYQSPQTAKKYHYKKAYWDVQDSVTEIRALPYTGKVERSKPHVWHTDKRSNKQVNCIVLA